MPRGDQIASTVDFGFQICELQCKRWRIVRSTRIACNVEWSFFRLREMNLGLCCLSFLAPRQQEFASLSPVSWTKNYIWPENSGRSCLVQQRDCLWCPNLDHCGNDGVESSDFDHCGSQQRNCIDRMASNIKSSIYNSSLCSTKSHLKPSLLKRRGGREKEKRERVCVRLCVCVWERERERR